MKNTLCGILLFFLLRKTFSTHTAFEECEVTDNISCDSEGDEDLCLDLGCCWDAGTCIHSNADPVGPDGAVCTVPSADKEECGVLGTTRDDCIAEGCCWYTREFDGAPWCYVPSESGPEVTEPDIDPTGVVTQTTTGNGGGGDTCDVSDDIPCDSEGDEDLCLDLGCCWNVGTCVHSNADPVGPDGAECSVPSAEKIECGVLGTTRDECVALGCCWYTREFDGAPWCYSPSETAPEVTDPESEVTEPDVDPTAVVPETTTTKGSGNDCDVTDSIPCDSEGEEDLCLDLGCCWDVGSCIHSNADPVGPEGAVCTVPSAEKVECGVLGTTRDECVGLGCCWYTREFDGAPWCYEPSEYEKPETEAPGPELTSAVEVGACDDAFENNDVCSGGANEELCLGFGCCWDDDEGCVLSNSDPVGPEGVTCAKATPESLSCGFEGVNLTSCVDKGCCWKATSDDGVPWCYYPDETVLAAYLEKREVCDDTDGISCDSEGDEDLCLDLGCCWDAGSCVHSNADPVGPEGAQCSVPSAEKVECGVLGFTRDECVAEGCCWYTREFDGAPWCYNPSGTVPQTTTTPASSTTPDVCDTTDSVVCYGGNEDECTKLGCCWDAGCTHSNADPVGPEGADCTVLSENKVECGVLGTSRNECIAIGCCWYTREFDGAPYCYYPANAEGVVTTPLWPEETLNPSDIPDFCDATDDLVCYGANEEECTDLGCCWDAGCTHSNADPVGPDGVMCTVPSDDKAECGELGTTRAQCLAEGCCWYTREFDGAPYCYYGVKYEGPVEECAVTEKQDCLVYNEDECLEDGCCWHQVADPFVPTCFFSRLDGPVGPEGVICVKRQEQRRSCGSHEITEDQCLTLGCCWQEMDITFGPSCYFGTLYEGPAWACIVEADNKTACGDSTDSEVCVNSGCCWSPTDDIAQPDCYQSLEAVPTGIPVRTTPRYELYCEKENDEKRTCGTTDTNQAQCLQIGCCWEEIAPADGPSCFYGLEYDGPIEECAVAATNKQPCGNQNERDICLEVGCCWSPTLDAAEPDCYEPDISEATTES